MRTHLDARRLAIAVAVMIGVSGCGTSSTQSPAAVSSAVATAAATPGHTIVAPTPTALPSRTAAVFARNPAPIQTGTPYSVAIDPRDFVAGIHHPFLPFTVGASFVFDGAEHVEVTVLPDEKVILGVKVTVVRDQVFEDGELIEDTLDWYAEDRDGNVWYFGEQTAEYENGKVTSTAGSWEAGVDGAQPGIVMLALPRAGDEYRQEFYAGEAEDMAAIVATSGEVSVPAGSWSGVDVLVTDEWTPLEPDVRERKTYVRGYGVVKVEVIKGGDEVTTLTSATGLS